MTKVFLMADRGDPHNWPDESYTGICRMCGAAFLGPKRAPFCVPCDGLAKARARDAAPADIVARLESRGDALSLEAAREILTLRGADGGG